VLAVKNGLTGAFFLLAVAANGLVQDTKFQWLNRTTAASVFNQVQRAFRKELSPGETIGRIGLRGDSALVVIGKKEELLKSYTVSRAFNFDLRTNLKSPLRTKTMEWFWMWHLERMTHFTSADDTDVVFRFATCTECEAERILASFHYSSNNRTWDLRDWSKEDGAGLLIGSDVQYGDGFYYYDCLHVVSDVTGDGVDDVAVRCRESLQPDPEKPLKRVTRDETLLYTAARGEKLTRIVIDKTSKYGDIVQRMLCATAPSSPLCRKPEPNRAKSHRP
jgi:hypothetical protein